MYLKRIACENMGPISFINIEPEFNLDGSPKPLIIVGKNGSGKSILISNIVDSFFEFGDQAYSDLAHKINMGHSYFKISGGNQIQLGKKGMVCYLNYSIQKEANKKAEYLYHVGDIDIKSFQEKIQYEFTSSLFKKDEEKNILNDKKLFENEFLKNSIVYFPPERYSIPYWMGNAYSTSHDYGNITLTDKFKNILNKPIISYNATEENTKWLIDVIVDSKAEISYKNNIISIKDKLNCLALKKSRENIEKIISEIVENNISLSLNWRNSGKSRLLLHSSIGNNAIAPTIDALSTGQSVLLNIFLTIIRYADATDVNNSINLNGITGIVIIDEIELHLHSDLQRKVLPRLIRLLPKVQFIITSHSPLFLLGMRDIFKDDGFSVFKMPNGEKISVEDFSEFEKAYTTMTETNKFKEYLHEELEKLANQSEKALIITEGSSDWKHMKRAWNKIKDLPEYAELDGIFEFLEYEPEHSKAEGKLKLQMSDSQLVQLCFNSAKIKQHRKMIFISDSDQPNTTKSLVDSSNNFKNWGNNVYSFQIPNPNHRLEQKICIEHYYTDEELKTEKNIAGKQFRLFMGNEFDTRGISLDKQYICIAKNECGPEKISILEGDSKTRVTLLNDETYRVALPKMQFSEAILNEEVNFREISSDNFKLIFNILKQILVSESIDL